MEPGPEEKIISSSSSEQSNSSSSSEQSNSSSSNKNSGSSSSSEQSNSSSSLKHYEKLKSTPRLERIFHNGCSKGQMDVIDCLLRLGVDVNAFDRSGKRPLHRVCSQTEPWVIDVVTKLLTNGADVDLDDENEWNALDYALFNNLFQPHVAQLLLDCSKKGVNKLLSDYQSYLWSTNSLEAVKFLVENGINVNQVYLDKTYLDEAHADEIEYLRSVGAKLYSEL